MGLFSNLTNDGLEEQEDRVGGGRKVHPTNIYPATVTALFAGQAESGAQYVELVAKFDEGGDEYRERLFITNKKGENFFTDKKDKTKKRPLPGFTLIDNLCLLTTDKPLCEQGTEERTFKVYDSSERKEVNKACDALVDVMGEKVYLGIKHEIRNGYKDGKDTNDKREENTISDVFHAELKLTVLEARNGKDTPEFFDAWLDTNVPNGESRVFNRFKEIKGAGSSSAPKGGASSGQRASLFAKK